MSYLPEQSFKIIETFKFHFPARVIENADGSRLLQTRDGSKGFWRSASESEAKLILSASSKARNLLLESKTDAPNI